jgi:redox-sensitive bicupin YhaK (pirin superfamily)
MEIPMNTVSKPIHSGPTPRRVRQTLRGLPTSDGAGVRLTRVIGTSQLPELDPFLMLDEFGTDRPEDYIAGFPDHPHRGFETVTYMLDGRMRHRDNHGNEGVLVPGSVQWMTAGRGIVHSEMPEQVEGRMRGFQLWINLPARDKMTAPRYQEYAPEAIPVAHPADGVAIKVIAGEAGGIRGPIEQPATDPLYVDVALAAGATTRLAVASGHHAFAYVYDGQAEIAGEAIGAGVLALLGDGEALDLRGLAPDSRVIVVAGRPLHEPVARMGPFVMNTQAEIYQAVADFQAGRF